MDIVGRFRGWFEYDGLNHKQSGPSSLGLTGCTLYNLHKMDRDCGRTRSNLQRSQSNVAQHYPHAIECADTNPNNLIGDGSANPSELDVRSTAVTHFKTPPSIFESNARPPNELSSGVGGMKSMDSFDWVSMGNRDGTQPAREFSYQRANSSELQTTRFDVDQHLNVQQGDGGRNYQQQPQQQDSYSTIASGAQSTSMIRAVNRPAQPPHRLSDPNIDANHVRDMQLFQLQRQQQQQQQETLAQIALAGGPLAVEGSDAGGQGTLPSAVLNRAPHRCEQHSTLLGQFMPKYRDLIKQGSMPMPTFIVTSIYLDRLTSVIIRKYSEKANRLGLSKVSRRYNGSYSDFLWACQVMEWCVSCTWLACLILANKFIHDSAYSNKSWSTWSSCSLQSINEMELNVTLCMEFDFYVGKEEFERAQVSFENTELPTARVDSDYGAALGTGMSTNMNGVNVDLGTTMNLNSNVDSNSNMNGLTVTHSTGVNGTLDINGLSIDDSIRFSNNGQFEPNSSGFSNNVLIQQQLQQQQLQQQVRFQQQIQQQQQQQEDLLQQQQIQNLQQTHTPGTRRRSSHTTHTTPTFSLSGRIGGGSKALTPYGIPNRLNNDTNTPGGGSMRAIGSGNISRRANGRGNSISALSVELYPSPIVQGVQNGKAMAQSMCSNNNQSIFNNVSIFSGGPAVRRSRAGTTSGHSNYSSTSNILEDAAVVSHLQAMKINSNSMVQLGSGTGHSSTPYSLEPHNINPPVNAQQATQRERYLALLESHQQGRMQQQQLQVQQQLTQAQAQRRAADELSYMKQAQARQMRMVNKEEQDFRDKMAMHNKMQQQNLVNGQHDRMKGQENQAYMQLQGHIQAQSEDDMGRANILQQQIQQMQQQQQQQQQQLQQNNVMHTSRHRSLSMDAQQQLQHMQQLQESMQYRGVQQLQDNQQHGDYQREYTQQFGFMGDGLHPNQ
ncbi:hypothetical protein SARC_02161 [Sphaeroforma arctica JP610]|uniref:Cyclin N-terminal domain-containing protein n=1 Tax=Sphaeroforma arctica JP610 TaxID=667725 RepID=A0A0L0G9I1_9EUKA|nr:hypothetical protein SARC_02161 [Sphaeroforma arctica JP610]KNC85677.1 hypothetical protein SARC_02161 [Sphaeroforma arctica JP610]|eukprot:XP_014159579.1 hypothetical protein SARC_02161 [Sphaeroforma arctica JP610]